MSTHEIVENNAPSDDQLEQAIAKKLEEIQSDKKRFPSRLFGRAKQVTQFGIKIGIGAVVLGRRSGKELLDRLVDEGASYQQHAGGDPLPDGTAETLAEQGGSARTNSSVRAKAVDRIHDLEKRLDSGVNNTLHFIGVPSRKDFEQLESMVNELTHSFGDLTAQLRKQGGPIADTDSDSSLESADKSMGNNDLEVAL